MFAQHNANGENLVIQVVWIYEHAIDFDGVRRFNHNLGYGLLGRRIERSPFGRYRWVSNHVPVDIDIAECARPRAELTDWADERSQLPTNAESGPGWHLGVLPLTDGSTAISLVVSHYLIDGFGLALTIIEALLGRTRDLGYPPPIHARDSARWPRMPAERRGTRVKLPGHFASRPEWPVAIGRKIPNGRHSHQRLCPSPSATTLAMKVSSCRLSRCISTRATGMPARRLSAGMVGRCSQRSARNSASTWDVDVPMMAPSPCNSP